MILSGSIQERVSLAKMARELACESGLKINISFADFQHVVCRQTNQSASPTIPRPEQFCPLITTEKGGSVIFTHIDAVFEGVVTTTTNIQYGNGTLTSSIFSNRDFGAPFLGRWVDNLETKATGAGTAVMKAYSVQLPLNLMVNRPIIHVAPGPRIVGLMIAAPRTDSAPEANQQEGVLQLAASGYVVREEIGSLFAVLETRYDGKLTDTGGGSSSTAGTDAATGQQKMSL